MNSVDGDAPSKCIVDAVSNCITIVHIPIHMEVDWISPENRCLANMSEFGVRDSAQSSTTSFTVNHKMGSILRLSRALISLYDYVSREETHFDPHIETFAYRVSILCVGIGLHCRVMSILQRFIESDCLSAYSSDGSALRLQMVPIR
jgi:hypothetical protein